MRCEHGYRFAFLVHLPERGEGYFFARAWGAHGGVGAESLLGVPLPLCGKKVGYRGCGGQEGGSVVDDGLEENTRGF